MERGEEFGKEQGKQGNSVEEEEAEETKYEPQVKSSDTSWNHPNLLQVVPQIDPAALPPPEMKPVKQTVTYDSSTGKMYEELGSSGSSGGQSHSTTLAQSHSQRAVSQSYFQVTNGDGRGRGVELPPI